MLKFRDHSLIINSLGVGLPLQVMCYLIRKTVILFVGVQVVSESSTSSVEGIQLSVN